MNYLAHAALAGPSPIALLGNLLGDAVKGPLPGNLAGELAAAVAAHRSIDAFADRHPSFVASRQRLFARFSHYAGVIVDVVYDHLLTRDWDRFHDESFDRFVDRAYAAFSAREVELPRDMAKRGRTLVDNDVLRRYATEEGLREALRRMEPRLRRRVTLRDAVEDLRSHRDAFTLEFRRVYRDLQQQSFG